MKNLQVKYIKNISNERHKIAENLKLDEHFVHILIQRGFDSEEKIKNYLNPGLQNLHQPDLFKNINEVSDEIKKAIHIKKQIAFYSTEKLDSVLSMYMLGSSVTVSGGKCSYHMFDEKIETNYLDFSYFEKTKDKTQSILLIIIGCNFQSKEDFQKIKDLGYEIIIIDQKKEILFDNIFYLNTYHPNNLYPFKDLCHAGVIGKVIQKTFGIEVLKKYLDLITIATIHSEVPLIDENRFFCFWGIQLLNKTKRSGFKLIESYLPDDENYISAYQIKFLFSDFFKTEIELGSYTNIIKLLNAMNAENSKQIFLNMKQNYDKKIEVETKIQKIFQMKTKKEPDNIGMLLFDEKIPVSLLSSICENLFQSYEKPIALFTKIENKYYGFLKWQKKEINKNIYYKNCSDFFILSEDEYENFTLSFFEKLKNKKTNEYKECENNVVYYEDVLKVKEINLGLVNQIRRMEPFGYGNVKPKFLIKNISMKNVIRVGKQLQHFSCSIYDETNSCLSISFHKGKPEKIHDLDVVCSLQINEKKGIKKPLCNIHYMQDTEDSFQRKLASSFAAYETRIIDSDLITLGLRPEKIKQFNNAGVFTVQELLNFLPRTYLDFRFPKKVNEISNKEVCSIIGTVLGFKDTGKMVWAMCKDSDDNKFMACWYHNSYVTRLLNKGKEYIFCGSCKFTDDGLLQILPERFSYDIEKFKRIIPEYKDISNMSADYISDSIAKALEKTPNTDYLEKYILDDFNLLSRYDAIKKLHQPDNDIDIKDGQERMIFDSLFKFNFILKSKTNDIDYTSGFKIKTNKSWDAFLKIIPYSLTNDQSKILMLIYDYLKTGKILEGLIQGDVGCGKTMIAFFSMLLAVENGHQACLVAPTEVLATQHYNELCEYMKNMGIEVCYLAGKIPAKQKRLLLENIKCGKIQMVVGTHAILQDTVVFKDLGMVIIDEQHRFGVKQRDKLLESEKKPHLLTMSATPIPRTLSMAVYGEHIQVYNILEKPQGRKEIITEKKNENKEIYDFMLSEIQKGHQCYVVCPLVEQSTSDRMANVTSVKEEVDNITKYFELFPEVKISNISGKMKKDLVEEEILKFKNLETNILISTTIIEVGVNVPNSTVMVIKNSERFGLAQLHQLRGRVGRGNAQSYCILQTEKDDPKADVICATNDGFEIAKQDLLLRGPGDYIGTSQTGSNKDIMLMIAEPELYKKISDLNKSIFSNPSSYAKYKYLLEENS